MNNEKYFAVECLLVAALIHVAFLLLILTETKYAIEPHEFLNMLKRKTFQMIRQNPEGLSQFFVLLN
jgi:hypothetical protein